MATCRTRLRPRFNTGTTVYLRRDFNMALASLYPGQKIELIGMSPEGYLLKTNYRNNTITGWIKPTDLPSGIDPTLFVQAQKNQKRHDAVAVAIANKNVIQGMTPEEVKQSVGPPDSVTSKVGPERLCADLDPIQLTAKIRSTSTRSMFMGIRCSTPIT